MFEFLAEEVLDQESDETRNFLLTTSILQQIEPEVAQRLAGIADAHKQLTGLEHRGLFTSRLDDDRYRYHNLFREFLARRLLIERSEAEVVGLHIHAASYFETAEQWAEAIHHYLQAGLFRQAARLVAKHGESVVSTSRLGLVDEWLGQLPADTIRQNARLSLLDGEAAGIRGDWSRAIESLERARRYFARKGDRRLESLACLKLSSIYSNYGDVERAAAVAESGLSLAPDDSLITRLRLRGNIAVTRGMISGPLESVVDECHQVAAQAEELALEHFAAIGLHNAGGVLLRIGRVREAIADLDRAAELWSATPTSPFGNWEELIAALIADRQLARARVLATESMRRTAPWARPLALAKRSYADVLLAEGNFTEAATVLRAACRDRETLANAYSYIAGALVEALHLAGGRTDEMRAVVQAIEAAPRIDPRHEAEAIPAEAVAIHALNPCKGACQLTSRRLARTRELGARFSEITARVKIGSLAFEHKGAHAKRLAWRALVEAIRLGFFEAVRWWARPYANNAIIGLRTPGGAEVLSQLADADPDGWRDALVAVLPHATQDERQALLAVLSKRATRESLRALRQIPGDDVATTYRALRRAQASRLFVRTLGGISVRRGGWDGPAIAVEKRRVRGLLGILAAYGRTTLTRDMAADLLWPDADGDSGLNSLNQTVFQLRRLLDPDYRQGDSPEYVVNSSEQVKLDDDLVFIDVSEISSLPRRLDGAPWAKRQELASRAIDLVRGEFLSDLRYEPWIAPLQVKIHNEVRGRLLPIAVQATRFDVTVAIDAANALINLDPFDEEATLALADGLRRSGRSRAARDLLRRYAELVDDDIDQDPAEARPESEAPPALSRSQFLMDSWAGERQSGG